MASEKQSAPKRQDRLLFCKNCSVSFLWSAEEQTHQYGNGGNENRLIRPTHCPGCRHIMPANGSERGLVKWYNRRKRFGFITRREQPDIFVHGSAIVDNQPLHPDTLVEFIVGETDRGLAALEVRHLYTDPQ